MTDADDSLIQSDEYYWILNEGESHNMILVESNREICVIYVTTRNS